MSTLEAINLMIALTRLVGHVADNMREVGDMIEAAQAEGRDLNNEEIARIRNKREAAVQAWREADQVAP